MHPLEEILGRPNTFLDRLLNLLSKAGIDVSKLYMDHICYRVEGEADYHSLQTQLLNHGLLISDKIIGGRPISVIKFDESYCYNERKIDLLELPSPKNGRPYPQGYEHVEFVVETDLNAFIESYPTIDFDLKGMNKKINRDVRIQFEGCSAKFHEHSLKYVIEVLEN